MLDTYIEEVFNQIVAQNSKVGPDGIPHSDIFEKQIQALLGIDGMEINRIIRILKESHKIFTFEIIKEDSDNDIKRVEGYVETDLQTIRKLKNFFQKFLMDEYEKQFSKRLLVHQIVKDIFSRGAFYKNTMLGQIGNKAIMLEEYESFIERNFNEFTDSWKAKKLAEVVLNPENKQLGESPPSDAAGQETAGGSPLGKRAIDSPKYQYYTSDKSKQSLDKVLQIYGVEFFFRINLRKYNFDLLKQVIESGEIDRRTDLIVLKEMIQKMKSNIGKDPQLLEHAEKIYKLERIISRQMLYSH
jgi:transcription initiation factor IIE alpha subunit